MAVFPSKKFKSASDANADAAARYRSALSRRPFLYFGLPFMAIIVAGSFVLTPATAVRYEKHDRKVKQLSKEDELAVRKNPRKVDWRDEYQVRWPCFGMLGIWCGGEGEDGVGWEWRLTCVQRLRADKDLDNWQQKRAERLPGEPDGTL